MIKSVSVVSNGDWVHCYAYYESGYCRSFNAPTKKLQKFVETAKHYDKWDFPNGVVEYTYSN